jgi:hypothetical protein
MHVLKGLGFLSSSEARDIAGLPEDYLETNGNPDEVGLLFIWDSETGEHFTHVADAAYVHMLKEGEAAGILDEEIRFPPEVAPLMTPGWPSDWAEEEAEAESAASEPSE